MFSQACVIPSVHGGVPLDPGGVPEPGVYARTLTNYSDTCYGNRRLDPPVFNP